MALRVRNIMLLTFMGTAGLLTNAVAQQQEAKRSFIYIQNENGSPFYVREQNNTVLSSSHAGYIIIPQLTKGNYVFVIGLPGDRVAETAFGINLNGDGDKGLLLREGNGQLALYSLKDFKEIQPVAVASAPGNRIVNIPATSSSEVASRPPAEQPPAEPVSVNQNETPAVAQKETSGTDAFSRMLDKIMGTKKPAVAAAPPQNQQSTALDSSQSNSAPGNNTDVVNKSVVPNNIEPIKSNVGDSQIVNNPNNEGTVSINNNVSGNITNPPPSTTSSAPNNGLQFINFVPDSSKKNVVSQPQTVTNNPAPAVLTTGSSPAEVTPSIANNDTVTQTGIINSDCQQLASEDFFQKVRRKMASRSNDEGMFHLAQKYFSGGTCFSTQQIQSLTYLFITDEYKFKFLEIAYLHTYDSSHFPSLIKTLGNDYYRGRFKAMVR